MTTSNEAPVLALFVIYNRPIDSPSGFLVRRWLVKPGHVLPGGIVGEGLPTLDAARAVVPMGLVNIGRRSEDDVKIVEVWV